jgi:hypothetical protein
MPSLLFALCVIYIVMLCDVVWCFAMLCDALVVLFRAWQNINCVIYIVVWKCRELTEIKFKKNRESLCRQLTDGKAFAVGGLTAKEDTWQLTVKSGNSGTTKCPRLSALPSAGPWLTAKGRTPRGTDRSSPDKHGPQAAALPSAGLQLTAKPAVNPLTGLGLRRCRQGSMPSASAP